MPTDPIARFFELASANHPNLVPDNFLYNPDTLILSYTFYFTNAKREYRNLAVALSIIAQDIRNLLDKVGIKIIGETNPETTLTFHLDPTSLSHEEEPEDTEGDGGFGEATFFDEETPGLYEALVKADLIKPGRNVLREAYEKLRDPTSS